VSSWCFWWLAYRLCSRSTAIYPRGKSATPPSAIVLMTLSVSEFRGFPQAAASRDPGYSAASCDGRPFNAARTPAA
jgi:hypothetical protein